MAISTAAAIVGGSIAGGLLGARGAREQAKGADRATSESARQFDITRRDAQPYISAGQSAISRLASLYGLSMSPGSDVAGGSGVAPRRLDYDSPTEYRDAYRDYLAGRSGGQAPAATGAPDFSSFYASPDYQFRLEEGEKAINRSAAARGKLLSGQAVKEGTRYASNLAAGEFGSYFDRLAAIAGIGQTGVAQSAAAGADSAGRIGTAQIIGGNARASGYQAINDSVQGGLSNYLLLQQLNNPQMIASSSFANLPVYGARVA